MCRTFLSIMFLVTLFYILQGVFSSYFIEGEYRYKCNLFQTKILEYGKFIKLSGQTVLYVITNSEEEGGSECS